MSRRNLINLIEHSKDDLPVQERFLKDVQSVIERIESKNARKPSKTYKPSSCVCLRQMYFMVTGADTDVTKSDYTGIGMADTGTRRHVAIQDNLLQLKEMGYDWEYVDVEQYIAEKQSKGKCLDITVVGKAGAETRLRNNKLNMNFMCDGILRQLSTDKYYLFEFKNQVSFKFNGKQTVDTEHKPQAALYCLNLDIDDVLFLYESRDTCELNSFLYHATEQDKQEQLNKIIECETYVENMIPPPKHINEKPCRWCRYKSMCRKVGK